MLIEHISQLPKVRGLDLEQVCTNQFTRVHYSYDYLNHDWCRCTIACSCSRNMKKSFSEKMLYDFDKKAADEMYLLNMSSTLHGSETARCPIFSQYSQCRSLCRLTNLKH